MPQGRQFDDPRFLGQYWLVRSTLDLALKKFFLFCVFLKEKWSPMVHWQWNNDKSFSDQADPDSNRSRSTDTWLSRRVLLFVSELVMKENMDSIS